MRRLAPALLVLAAHLLACRGRAKQDEPPSPSVAPMKSSTPNPRRSLAELVNTTDPGWPVVLDLVAKAKNDVEVLPVDPARGAQALLAIQVTTRSMMGAVAYSSGGLLIDHGWVRVLGGGHARLPRDIGTWNFPHGVDQPARLPNAMLVADDALGGFFAVNGGAFDGPLGNVFYLAPDTLRWQDLHRGHSDFLNFLFQGDLAKFYAGQRWSGWQEEVAKTAGDRAFSIYPFLWTSDGGPIDQRSRKAVPIEELWHVYAIDLPKQLADVPDGSKVQIVIKNRP